MNQDEFFDKADEKSKVGRFLGKAEVRRQYDERMKALAVPELRRHFSEADALRLVEYFSQTPSVGTQEEVGMPYDLRKLSPEAREYLAREVQGRRIIEIGDAGRKRNKELLLELGAQSYESTDPKSGGIDGLSYLMRQPDESAIVTSFGVLDWGVLYGDCRESRVLDRYNCLLGENIARVTPRGAITLHGADYIDDLENAGFKRDADAPRELDTWTPQRGGLIVMRK